MEGIGTECLDFIEFFEVLLIFLEGWLVVLVGRGFSS
jgi:hypothetical protein